MNNIIVIGLLNIVSSLMVVSIIGIMLYYFFNKRGTQISYNTDRYFLRTYESKPNKSETPESGRGNGGISLSDLVPEGEGGKDNDREINDGKNEGIIGDTETGVLLVNPTNYK